MDGTDDRAALLGVRAVLSRAQAAPAELSDADYVELLNADGPDLETLCAIADELRRETVGDDVTYVVNRNLDTEAVGAGTDESHDLVARLVDEAWELGATEVCVQGPVRTDVSGREYLELVEIIRSRAPVHIHAFRPAEVADAATRLGTSPREFLRSAVSAGLTSVPGTAARILDDEVRTRLLGRPDLPVRQWLELIETAHRIGLQSTSTMVYGHVESPEQQVAHLRTIVELQERTGGFTEFIPMPLTSTAIPEHLRAVARPGPSERETRAVHAVARLMLHGRIDHVQTAWTKLGFPLSQSVLRGGADDLGGLLLDGSLWPAAGAEGGRQLSVSDAGRIAAEIGRGVRPRTTSYGDPFAVLNRDEGSARR